MQKITVHTGRPYDILIDDGLLSKPVIWCVACPAPSAFA